MRRRTPLLLRATLVAATMLSSTVALPAAGALASEETAASTESSTTESSEPTTAESSEPTTESTEPSTAESSESATAESSEPSTAESSEPAATESSEPATAESTESGTTESSEPATTESTESATTESSESGTTESSEAATAESTEPTTTESSEPATTESTEPGTTESSEPSTAESSTTESSTTESSTTESSTTESSTTESTTSTPTYSDVVQAWRQEGIGADNRKCIEYRFVYSDGLEDLGWSCDELNVDQAQVDNDPSVVDADGNLVAELLHVSCSDTFPGGYGEVSVLGTTADGYARQALEWHLVRVNHKGTLTECSGTAEPDPQLPTNDGSDTGPGETGVAYYESELVAGWLTDGIQGGAKKCIEYWFSYSDDTTDLGYACDDMSVDQEDVDFDPNVVDADGILVATELHVSCSDTFPGGYGEVSLLGTTADGTARQAINWQLVRVDGKGKVKTCSSPDAAAARAAAEEPETPGNGGVCTIYEFLYTDGAMDEGEFCGDVVSRDDVPTLNANAIVLTCADRFPNGEPELSDLDGRTVADWSIMRADGVACSDDDPEQLVSSVQFGCFDIDLLADAPLTQVTVWLGDGSAEMIDLAGDSAAFAASYGDYLVMISLTDGARTAMLENPLSDCGLHYFGGDDRTDCTNVGDRAERAAGLAAAGSAITGSSLTDVTATIVVPEGWCPTLVSFTSYYAPSGDLQPFDAQDVLENVTYVLQGGETVTVTLAVAPCTWQADLYTGTLLDPIPVGGHSTRLIDFTAQTFDNACYFDCYEYDFLYTDGSRDRGTTCERVITPDVVPGLVANSLVVTCQDQFPSGYPEYSDLGGRRVDDWSITFANGGGCSDNDPTDLIQTISFGCYDVAVIANSDLTEATIWLGNGASETVALSGTSVTLAGTGDNAGEYLVSIILTDGADTAYFENPFTDCGMHYYGGDSRTDCINLGNRPELRDALIAAGSQITATGDGSSTASIVLPEGLCPTVVSFTVYESPSGEMRPFDRQDVYDNVTLVLTGGESATVTLPIPSCAFQVDLYLGHVLDPIPTGGHSTRLLDYAVGNLGIPCAS